MPITEDHNQELSSLEFRLTAEAKEKIERAALVSGLSVTDFAIYKLVESAGEVLERHCVTTLSEKDRELFLAMLDADGEPNVSLREAAGRYKQINMNK